MVCSRYYCFHDVSNITLSNYLHNDKLLVNNYAHSCNLLNYIFFHINPKIKLICSKT